MSANPTSVHALTTALILSAAAATTAQAGIIYTETEIGHTGTNDTPITAEWVTALGPDLTLSEIHGFGEQDRADYFAVNNTGSISVTLGDTGKLFALRIYRDVTTVDNVLVPNVGQLNINNWNGTPSITIEGTHTQTLPQGKLVIGVVPLENYSLDLLGNNIFSAVIQNQVEWSSSPYSWDHDLIDDVTGSDAPYTLTFANAAAFPVPSPGALALFGVGCLASVRRRR